MAVLGGRVPAGAEAAGVALVVAALVLNSFAPAAPAIPAARAPAALAAA